MLNYSVILKKSKVKQNDVTLYLTVLVRVHDNNKTEVSPSNWLNEQQVVAIQGYTPLNYSVNKRKIEENKGDFTRFNKGANLIVLRKIEYPTYNSFVVLVLNNTGISSKEVKEAELVKVAMTRKPNPLIQNAIIRGTAVYCYEDAPFDTVNIESKAKKKPISKKKEFADLGLSNNPTTEMPDSLVESIYSSIPEANSDLLYDILRYELTTKYNATKIVQGKEKALEVDNNIEFIVDYMLTQLTPYTNELSSNKKNVMKKNCLEWFAPIKNNKVLYNKVEKAFS